MSLAERAMLLCFEGLSSLRRRASQSDTEAQINGVCHRCYATARRSRCIANAERAFDGGFKGCTCTCTYLTLSSKPEQIYAHSPGWVSTDAGLYDRLRQSSSLANLPSLSGFLQSHVLTVIGLRPKFSHLPHLPTGSPAHPNPPSLNFYSRLPRHFLILLLCSSMAYLCTRA